MCHYRWESALWAWLYGVYIIIWIVSQWSGYLAVHTVHPLSIATCYAVTLTKWHLYSAKGKRGQRTQHFLQNKSICKCGFCGHSFCTATWFLSMKFSRKVVATYRCKKLFNRYYINICEFWLITSFLFKHDLAGRAGGAAHTLSFTLLWQICKE